ncbi:adenylyl-sulfate kinase [Undibacterium sp. 14-3-2]|jgi:adenylylsulfate kinase|uniref:adenylyl-sulfate kinase n=1 Tax=Undibacterium sp. 14-3-2 TaxID=2800129 RepID=UPI0019055041|nr:adenylyl-sulfate kinase [Undibacterium sp. 14-3-2]MBK1891411.1 adenylyl-sulfate kinase [Undibacterium sp. 14-3-2]
MKVHPESQIEKLSPDAKRDARNSFGRFVERPQPHAIDVTWHSSVVCANERADLLQQHPATIWLTGLSGAGKSTIAYTLEKLLLDRGHCGFVVDGDNLRHHLNSDLGFSPEDRRENIRRAAEVAHLLNEAGLIVITAFISPLIADRMMAADIIGPHRFVEVYVNTSTEVCERRDTKGLYAKARKGEILEFTGISAPYEMPQNPRIEIKTELQTVDEIAEILYQYLVAHHFTC